MSLQRKVILVFIVLGVVFALGSYAGLQKFVFPAFEKFERDSAAQNLARAKRAIDAEARALDILNREYSEWDHAYDFVRGLRDEFIDENLDVSYWHTIDINFMAYFDLQARMLWGAAVDPSHTREISIGGEFVQPLTLEHPLLQHRDDLGAINGILKARSAPMLVSANPVLTSGASGPAVGTLIIGRYIDASRIETLARRASVNLDFYQAGDADNPPEIDHMIRAAADTGKFTSWSYDNETIRTEEALIDVFGNPSFLLQATEPRTITAMGRNTIKAAMVFLLIATAIFLFAATMFIGQLIVGPIGNLTRHILAIRETGDLSQQFDLTRGDEIGLLATEFGELTANLADVKAKLETARDQALESSRAKSEFLARMSHEIRTPMNGVLGMIELLSNSSLNESQRRYAETIHDSADSLLDIINDVLDFSKLEAGKLRIENLIFDLNEFLADTIRTLRHAAQEKGLSLDYEVPHGPSLAVYGDPFRLRQVLTNLIGNAIKFTNAGVVLLRVAAEDVDQEYKNVSFEVVDTGIGINTSKQELIFDSFVQEDGSTTRRFGGTGLGLAISKELVTLMGGELRVASKPGKGSTFSFSLRMRASSESNFSTSARLLQQVHLQPRHRRTASKRLKGRVLLAEDNAVNQSVARGMLSAIGIESAIADNGEEAVQIASREAFDAILMDCQMPVLDGYQATRAIREMEAASGRMPVPIIAVTANALTGDREKCLAEGMNDYLSKPYTSEQLAQVLAKFLDAEDHGARLHAAKTASQTIRTSPPQSEDAVLDPKVLHQLLELQSSGTPDLVQRVIRTYLDSSEDLVATMSQAVQEADHDGIRKTAHALKSASANVGALQFAELCKKLEAAGQAQDLATASELWEQFQPEYKRVFEALSNRSEEAAA